MRIYDMAHGEPAPKPEPPVDMLDGWVEPGEKGGTILRLEEPVEMGSQVTTRLDLARMRAKHLRVMKDDSTDSMLVVLQELANVPRRVIDNLGLADTMRALEVVRRGFPSGPATGGAS